MASYLAPVTFFLRSPQILIVENHFLPFESVIGTFGKNRLDIKFNFRAVFPSIHRRWL